MNRRHAMLLASGLLRAQRMTPVEELVNTFEMEAIAQRKLAPELFREIAGSDRAAFERITFRPRMMVNTLALDLTTELFGETHFSPVLVGPLARQGRFHPEGEKAMQAGATAAKASVVAPAEMSVPIASSWVQLAPGAKVPAGAKVVVVSASMDWKALRASTRLPMVVKGVMSPQDARLALESGADGLIVSAYRTPLTSGIASSIAVLPALVAEVKGKAPILIDGSFRRGSDVLKALALGAHAVLVGRPALWGLAAYGARGVQQVLEQLQTELARDMAMCGLQNCRQATRQYVRIHRR